MSFTRLPTSTFRRNQQECVANSSNEDKIAIAFQKISRKFVLVIINFIGLHLRKALFPNSKIVGLATSQM